MATIKFKSPTGASVVSICRQTYQADKKGVIEVPEEFADTMYSFGFVRANAVMPEVAAGEPPAEPAA